MGQKFIARERFEFSNGAIGWRPGGPMDCLGPYAKVENCPIDGTNLRRTCYASGYADTYSSVPANTCYKGRYIGGFLTVSDGAISFVSYGKYRDRLPQANYVVFTYDPMTRVLSFRTSNNRTGKQSSPERYLPLSGSALPVRSWQYPVCWRAFFL